jgi:DNA polymerase-3 subunit delta'
MQLRDVVGQHEIKKRLVNTYHEGRVSHAQLLIGPEGNGNLALALAYAQFINCPQKSHDDSCGTCPSCRKYSNLVHPDLHFVFPIVNKKKDGTVSDHFITEWRKIHADKHSYFGFNDWLDYMEADDKQGSIQKSESSEIIRKLNLKVFEADYKTMIIWMVEKMNETCANKILKVLEEPPPNTLFLMIAENTEQMLSTILSRSQMLKVPRIDTQSLAQFVAKEHALSSDEAMAIAANANGNVVRARELVNLSETTALFFENFVYVMRKSYTRDVKSMIDWAASIDKWGREKQKSFIEYCLQMIRTNFLLNTKNNNLAHANNQELEFSTKFAPYITEYVATEFSQLLDEAHYHVERNGKAKIIFLDTALKFSIIFSKKQ